MSAFLADLERMNTALRAMGALLEEDGEVVGIDPTVAPPALLSAYSGLVSYGYANGLL